MQSSSTRCPIISESTNIDFAIQECEALQNEEYLVLESIYPDCVSSDLTHNTLKLEIPVEFNETRQVCLVQDEAMTPSSTLDSNTQSIIYLTSLPSLMINITLPPSYPLHSPPCLTSIRANYLWPPYALQVQDLLTRMWQPGEGILYTWIEFIRSGDFLYSLSLGENHTIQIPHPSPRVLAALLKDSEATLKSIKFAQNSYSCSICFTSYKGSKCIQLSCTHIFCRSCLEEFWKLCIAEGEIERVSCPDPVCVKTHREADVQEVAKVVTDAELERWRWLREKRDIEKDASIIHCPMAFCQTPVPKPIDVDETSGYDRLRSCPVCSFSFCALCQRTWHGPISACPVAYSEELVLNYLNLPEGSIERQVTEKKFGKANVQKLVATYLEERANKEWLKSSTMACPGCQVHVEKSLGCNHMTCTKCQQHFCYRCGTKLLAKDPYKHFSTTGQPCYNKLFDSHIEDNEWQPVEGFETD